MSFRRRLTSKPSLSRRQNKIGVTNRHDVAEIESWVDFTSRNENDEEKILIFLE